MEGFAEMTAYHGTPLSNSDAVADENTESQEPYHYTNISATGPLLDAHSSSLATAARGPRQRAKLLSDLRWWLPEVFATVLSLTSLIVLVLLMWNYQGRSLDLLHLPAPLTINGLVEFLSTINRAALMVPVGSVMSQEVWLWLSSRSDRSAYHRGRLRDLEISDSASRGAWGSADFLSKPERRLVIVQAQAVFNVSDFAMSYLKVYLSSTINGTIALEETGSIPSSDTVQAIWNTSSDLDSWIINLALSMTNVIRTDTPQPDDMYNGTAYHLGYQVRWEWIVLPAALVLLSTLVLIVAVVQTSRSSVSAWKGSPLTLLFTSVEVENRKQAVDRKDAFQGLQDLVGSKEVLMKGDTAGGRVLKVA